MHVGGGKFEQFSLINTYIGLYASPPLWGDAFMLNIMTSLHWIEPTTSGSWVFIPSTESNK
jgi:hypothetical protein